MTLWWVIMLHELRTTDTWDNAATQSTCYFYALQLLRILLFHLTKKKSLHFTKHRLKENGYNEDKPVK